MGICVEHEKVKLVIPVLYVSQNDFSQCLDQLKVEFGPTDYQSEEIDFHFTDYYNPEMGKYIKRKIISFEKLITPDSLTEIKLKTNHIEQRFSENGNRKINLDPGYIQLGKFILATTKDQQHRIYIGKGIYEEVTLYYRNKKWQCWEWTYPDYQSEVYRNILNLIRNNYKQQLQLETVRNHQRK